VGAGAAAQRGGIIPNMKAGTKFALGAVLIVGSVAISCFRISRLAIFPHAQRARPAGLGDPSFYDLGLKVGARVVPGTVQKRSPRRRCAFTSRMDRQLSGHFPRAASRHIHRLRSKVRRRKGDSRRMA